MTQAFSPAASYTLTDGHFDSGTRNLDPKWHEVIGQADDSFSKYTDVYLEGLYQVVTNGGGVAVFKRIDVQCPAIGKQSTVVACHGLAASILTLLIVKHG